LVPYYEARSLVSIVHADAVRDNLNGAIEIGKPIASGPGFEQGYCGASVRDIVQAAEVPQGSFTNHFRSKKAFCLEVLDRYLDLVRQNIEKTRRGDGSRRPCLHGQRRNQPQLLLRRPAGRLNRQAVEDRGNVSSERRAICSLWQVAILDSSLEPLPEHGYN
jgi:AcrR family transcriptional regulator